MPWQDKFEKKLSALTDMASKESIQTLANWIAFNRKHAATVASVLANALKESKNNPNRQWLYWQLIHEILILEQGAPKWEKLLDLRIALGEALPLAMEKLGSDLPPQLEEYLKEWNDSNAFGGPSLISQIRRLYQNRNSLTSQVAPSNTKTEELPSEPIESSTSAQNDATAEPASTKAITIKEDASAPVMDSGPEMKKEEDQASQQRRTSFSHLSKQVEYDFESKGVPYGKVEAKEFLEPCKAIATLQIARDVRTSTAVEISTALANLPTDIQETCKELDSGTLPELDAAQTNDFSIRIPSNLLDLDIDDETSTLHTFQDIVQRQQKAREKLIQLLVKSRCQFGANDAARAFYSTEGLADKLQKRKQLLSDALELEGLDTSQIVDNNSGSNKKRDQGQDLEPFSWYTPEEDKEVTAPDSKKQRTSPVV
mmetsp:Transcript_4446/g.8205  ORF Transcript_4446/g.8205 Transcript_4446/m.8205 type:complete len:428 (-) Transcript_4446:1386-2669(-)